MKTIQAKHLPEKPILEFLASRKGVSCFFDSDTHAKHFLSSIVTAFPAGTPPEVIRAKMRSLIKRGLVDGCACGCRGDYEITNKGRSRLTE